MNARTLAFAACCLCFQAVTLAQTELPRLERSQFLQPDLELQGAPDPDAVFLNFGDSVSVFGDTLLVGMPRFNNETGRVAVFKRGRSGQWQRAGSIDPVGGQPGDEFGSSVVVGRDLAVVNAHVYRRIRNRFQLIHKLPDGAAVGIAGNTVFHFVAPEVRVLHADSKGRLRLVQRLRSPSGTTDGFATRPAAASNDTLVVAVQDLDGQGAAYVYRQRGKFWHLQQKLIAADGEPGDDFAATLDVRGNVIAIGAPMADRAAAPETCNGGFPADSSGAVYVFVRRGHLWSETQKVRSPNPECDSLFGWSVWLGRDRLVTLKPETNLRFDDELFYIHARVFGQFEPFARLENDPQSAWTLDVGGQEMFRGDPIPGFATSIGEVEVFSMRSVSAPAPGSFSR